MLGERVGAFLTLRQRSRRCAYLGRPALLQRRNLQLECLEPLSQRDLHLLQGPNSGFSLLDTFSHLALDRRSYARSLVLRFSFYLGRASMNVLVEHGGVGLSGLAEPEGILPDASSVVLSLLMQLRDRLFRVSFELINLLSCPLHIAFRFVANAVGVPGGFFLYLLGDLLGLPL
jgi:hypothetical protein